MKHVVDFVVWTICVMILWLALRGPLGTNSPWPAIAIMFCTTFYVEFSIWLDSSDKKI